LKRAHIILQIATFVAIIGFWEFLSTEGLVDPLFLPPPSKILLSFANIEESILITLYETFLKTFISFLIGSMLGITVGVLIGSRPLLHDVIHPYVFGLYSIPRIIFLPLIILFLGIGFNSTIFYAVFHTILPVIIVVSGGIKNIDRRLIYYAISLGASGWQIYSKVILPAALPSIISALRLGIIFSLLGTLIAEMYLSLGGVGFLMIKFTFAFKTAELFAVTLLVALLAIIISTVLGEVSKRIEEKRT
jgi:NitT/TauT family transport system permease protein